jgi:hypothetical protein
MFKNVGDTSPPAEVVSQSPEAGARVEFGATVQLILTPPARANQPNPSRQLPADSPSMRRPREFPPLREDPPYEANPPQQQQQQQQAPPPASGKDPNATNASELPPK